jgi:hypothetical protein
VIVDVGIGLEGEMDLVIEAVARPRGLVAMLLTDPFEITPFVGMGDGGVAQIVLDGGSEAIYRPGHVPG